MAYMTIQTQTESYLKLIRKPTLLSQFILAGMLVGVFGVIFFGISETFLKNAALWILVLAVTIYTGEGYDICELDIAADEARLCSLHWGQHLLGGLLPRALRPQVQVWKLSDIKSADVETQDSDDHARRVILSTEYDSFGIAKTFTHDSDHETIAETVNTFLNKVTVKQEDYIVENMEVDDSTDENSQDDVDSEFENISKADVEGFEEENEIAKGEESEKDKKDNEVDIKETELKSSD